MKFYKHKQIARLTFLGFNDELINDDNSIYTTILNGFGDNQTNNSKRMRFKLSPNIQNLEFSKNAYIVIESCFLPDIYNYGNQAEPDQPEDIRFAYDATNVGTTLLRMKNLNCDYFDSQGKSHNDTLIFSAFNSGQTYLNPDTSKLYNFRLSNNFLRNGYIEFDLIYVLYDANVINLTEHVRSLRMFQISFVIYDENEEELLLKDTDEVNLKLMKPFNGGIPIYK